MNVTASNLEPRFSDPETVIADFLGDILDGHARMGGGLRRDYRQLRALAQVLIIDLKESDLGIVSTKAPLSEVQQP